MMTETKSALPVRRVTLYTSGVGYFERSGEIEGDAQFTFHFPVGQINDVLSSLVLVDGGGGSILPVTYGANDPVGRALQAFSVNLGDNPSRGDLLNRMRGASVRVSTHTGTQPVAGTILGVESHTVALPDGMGTTEAEILNLLCGAGLQSIPLERVASIEIDDPELAEDLSLALSAVGKSRDSAKRPLTLSFAGDGSRSVAIAYITETPAWQTSYRLVIPDAREQESSGAARQARVQGWAIVQNTSQDDWRDVALTLVSGRPISFVQDLYTPLYVRRPTVAPRIQALPTPQTYGSDFGADLASFGSPAQSYGVGSEPFPAAAVPAGAVGVANVRYRKESGDDEQRKLEKAMKRGLITQEEFQSRSATGAALGDALFSYAIDIPVTVPREESAMIPFLLGEADAMPISVYNRTVQDHPLLGVSLNNTTGMHLMGGPVTVFSADSEGAIAYTGEALIDDTEPGQERILTYAVDLAVDIACETPDIDKAIAGFAISRGVIHMRERRVRATRYRIHNHDASARLLVIEHKPAAADWTLIEPEKPDERTAQYWRFKRNIAAGEASVFVVREQYEQWQSVGLIDSSVSQFGWAVAHAAITDDQKAAIEDILARRNALEAIERRIEPIQRQLQRIDEQQERIRQNMAALDHQSDLYRRYIAQLDAQETEIAGLQAQLREEENALEAAREELAEFVSGLEI